MWKYYITGVLVSMITGFYFMELWRVFEVSISKGNLIFFIPVGLLAGYISAKLENKFGATWFKKLSFVLLTIIVSAILTYIIFNLVWGDFIYWFIP